MSRRRAKRIRASYSRGTCWLSTGWLCRSRVSLGDPFENEGAVMLALERYGYDISDGPAAIRAFQRRWRPELIDGEIDLQVGAMLFALLLDRDSGKTR